MGLLDRYRQECYAAILIVILGAIGWIIVSPQEIPKDQIDRIHKKLGIVEAPASETP